MPNKLPERMERRELLRLASAALLGLVAAPGQFAFPAELRTVAQMPDWKPAFFNAHQNETVMALTETILPRTDTPGANDAKVYRYLDLFMATDNVIDKQQFVDGLAWIDQYARQKQARSFKELTAEQQTSLLNDMAGLSDAKVPHVAHAFFNQAKNMTAMIYYATREGFAELNKIGGPPATVGCEHSA